MQVTRLYAVFQVSSSQCFTQCYYYSLSLLEVTPAALPRWSIVTEYFSKALLMLRNYTNDAFLAQNARICFGVFWIRESYLVCVNLLWVILDYIFYFFLFLIFCALLLSTCHCKVFGYYWNQNDKHINLRHHISLLNIVFIHFVPILFWLSLVESPCYCCGLTFWSSELQWRLTRLLEFTAIPDLILFLLHLIFIL